MKTSPGDSLSSIHEDTLQSALPYSYSTCDAPLPHPSPNQDIAQLGPTRQGLLTRSPSSFFGSAGIISCSHGLLYVFHCSVRPSTY
jgi:hypothetical protein